MASTIEIFCCYAHEDKPLLQELTKQLLPLVHQGIITLWADTDIGAGMEWEMEIEKHLNTAHIILLLVSPDFMASEYIYSKEMKRAIARQEQGEARVIPVILRPIHWQEAPFGKLQALPEEGKPATSSSWHSLDEAFFNVAEGIKKTIETSLAQNQKTEKQRPLKDVSHKDARSDDETLGLPEGARPLPRPTRNPPYHLSLDEILSPVQIENIHSSGQMVFHVVGNTGGVNWPQAQEIVAIYMQADYHLPDIDARPYFFYHLGDIVYYYGQAKEYYSQFYLPYEGYPGPIFAIPGNHDGATTDKSAPSLAAFMNNFCAPTFRRTKEGMHTSRSTMIQPNSYWTLEAPFMTVIGLYTNVPEGGWLDNKQIAWLASELRNAPSDKALILTMHHAIYSADANHLVSPYMRQVLEQAILKAGRIPDAVLASHVINYQRFTCAMLGYEVPFIVAGAGGYWNLHAMAKGLNGKPQPTPYAMPEMGVTLENYCDDRHGYMKVEVTARTLKGEYFAVPHPNESRKSPAVLIDSFSLDLKKHSLKQ